VIRPDPRRPVPSPPASIRSRPANQFVSGDELETSLTQAINDDRQRIDGGPPIPAGVVQQHNLPSILDVTDCFGDDPVRTQQKSSGSAS